MKSMVNKTSIVMLSLFSVAAMSAQGADISGKTISEMYPGLSSGALCFATLGELPESVLLMSGDLQISIAEMDEELLKADSTMKDQLNANKLLILEGLAVKQLLLREAQGTAAPEETAATQDEQIQAHIERLTADVAVTDEEVNAFYQENKDMCGGATLEQIKDQLQSYVLEQKKQDKINEHIRTMGQRTPILLAAAWTNEQARLAMDNPVDKARASGKPSLVDFGSTGCRPCDMMAPILDALKTKYDGKANVIFVHVREHQVLASRYGIRSIPVQVFFDKEGKEVFRHTGFFPREEIEKKMVELGVE